MTVESGNGLVDVVGGHRHPEYSFQQVLRIEANLDGNPPFSERAKSRGSAAKTDLLEWIPEYPNATQQIDLSELISSTFS
jgi:hypothetical protein